MKKILFTIGLLLMTCSSVFALSMPRWGMTSIDVYIPECEYSSTIKKAFNTWASASGNKLRFRYYSTRFASNNAPIRISILNGKAPHQIINSNRSETTGYFTNMDEGFINRGTINIYTRNRNDKPNSSQDVGKVLLTEVGYILGMDKFYDDCNNFDTVMCIGNNRKTNLTSEDKKDFLEKYNRTHEDIRKQKSKN